MTQAITQRTTDSSSRVAEIIRHDPTAFVREITRGLVAIWPFKTAPRHAAVMSKRAKIMNGQADPFGILYLICRGAIDEGKPLGLVLQPFKDFIAAIEQYAERKQRRESLGVLSFQQAHIRLVTRSLREGCEAEVATAGVDLNDNRLARGGATGAAGLHRAGPAARRVLHAADRRAASGRVTR